MPDQKKENRLALLAALGGNAIWGFSFLFTRTALKVIGQPAVLLSMRFIIAFCIMSTMLLLDRVDLDTMEDRELVDEVEDIKEILEYAASDETTGLQAGTLVSGSFMDAYSKILADKIRAATGEEKPLEDILGAILDYAVENKLIEDGVVSRDLFDTKLMGILTPRPSEVRARFAERYNQSPSEATDWYYAFSQATDYIRMYLIVKDGQPI